MLNLIVEGWGYLEVFMNFMGELMQIWGHLRPKQQIIVRHKILLTFCLAPLC